MSVTCLLGVPRHRHTRVTVRGRLISASMPRLPSYGYSATQSDKAFLNENWALADINNCRKRVAGRETSDKSCGQVQGRTTDFPIFRS